MIGAFPGADALAERAADRPADPAFVVEGGEDLSFGGWERRSDRLARGLAGRGVGHGDRIALRFDARQWGGFAVAYVGVLKAGAVAVLVPSGLARRDAERAVRSDGVRGLICPPHLALPDGVSPWTAEPAEVEVEVEVDEGDPAPASQPDPTATAELLHALAPLARPHPLCSTHADLATRLNPGAAGWLVHTWAPGTQAGQHALYQVLAGAGGGAATVARFTPGALVALVARLRATTCGLTPGLAAALVGASGDTLPALGSVATVVLSRGGVDPRLRSRLLVAFPAAAVVDLDERDHPVPLQQDDPAPAGPSQLGMLWHEQLAPGSFNLPSLVRRYRGQLDVGALERALGELVRRHEPLGTTFQIVAGTPRQDVRIVERFRLPIVDLSDMAAAGREAEAAGLVAEASSRPFDLAVDPLFAPRLVRLGDADHVLVVRLHHAAFDDWSVDVFRRDLSALYTAFTAGQPSPLPDLAVRFVDVCRRQQARLAGEVGDRQRAYWRAEMAGAPLAVQVPLGEHHQIGPDRPGAGEPLRHDLSPELSRRVRALAPRLRATPFMTVLAAFGVVLARRTAQDDLVIASVVAGRGATALEPLIGCFTKKVLLRLRLDGDPTFPELVNRTRASVLGALAHQDLPFEAVVQDTLGPSAAAHGVVAQVPVVFQGETPQQARLVMPGLEVGPFEVPASARREHHFSGRGGGEGDGGPAEVVWGDGAYLGTFLILSLLEAEGGLSFIARGVFHRPAAQRLLLELDAVLDEIASSPERRLSELGSATRTGPDRGVDRLDRLELRGLHLSRSRLERALAGCPGVADVAVTMAGAPDGARLVACVVAEREPPPTLAQLRASLWAALPGSPWPAAAVVLPAGTALPRLPDGRLDPDAVPPLAPEHPGPPAGSAAVLGHLWAGGRGPARSPSATYWQDFSFLVALAEARAAGMPITDEQVTRCRTPEMLAAALAAADAG